MAAFRKTLSVILVLGLMIGGIPIFFSQSAEAAAVVVVEKDDSAMDLLASRGYLYIDVSQFQDEGGDPIPGYNMLIEWDFCYMELNPLAGFGQTKRVHHADTIISDEKGKASYLFDLPNGCWTENAWLRGAGQGWQSPPDYYLGQMASRSLHLDIYTQPSGATGYAIARADTLGLIQDWYEMVPYNIDGTNPDGVSVYGSNVYAGSAKLQVTSVTQPINPTGYPLSSGSASVGTIADYQVYPSTTPYLVQGSYTASGVASALGSGVTVDGHITGDGKMEVSSHSASSPNILTVGNISVYGPTMYFMGFVSSSPTFYYQLYLNGALAYPSSGSWATFPTSGSFTPVAIPLPYEHGLDSTVDVQLRIYATGTGTFIPTAISMYFPARVDLTLTNLDQSMTSTTLSVLNGKSVNVDLTGHLGTWQISGMSSTLTQEDLVPVNAKITSIYPLVISNPRFDKTPVAGAGNGLKFDAYNLKDSNATATIYLSLIADGNTTVWSTTVGQRSYPPWVNESQFTTIHLTGISFPADPRKQYDLRITSGGAITEIPVVFYPPELDPDVVYGPKEDLDEIIKAFGTVNAAALKTYYNWAVDMELRNIDLRSQVDNYTKIFKDRHALDELEAAKGASARAAEMITALKEICKSDPAGTNIGTLETLGQGIWNEHLAALLHREAAVGYEAGDTAFANSTARDAFYVDVNGQRIFTGWDDKGGINNMESSANWVALGVAVIAGGVVSYLLWTQLAKYMPKGGTKAMRRIKLIMPLAIGIVAGILVAIATYIITVQVIMAISNAAAGLGSLFGG